MTGANPLVALGAEIVAAANGGVMAHRLEAGELVLDVRRESVLTTMTLLRDRFGFAQCMDITAVDHPARPDRFDVVWNLLNLVRNVRARIVTTTDEMAPVASVCGIWPAATWFEREVWDLFGIAFDGQPDLRRLLTDYGFEGHPLRKDFPLTGHVELRYDEEQKRCVYEPVKLTQDFRSFDFLSPWEGMTTLPGDEKAAR
jgi:NADH-quinone oxidoreductase subunit C